MLTKKEDLKSESKNNKTIKNNCSTTTSQAASCCHPPAKTVNQMPAKSDIHSSCSSPQSDSSADKKENCSKTRITVKYDAGFPNQIYIRGKGANLNWEKGILLKNVKADEWTWETDAQFTNCEFKILINDRVYENGDNHQLHPGSTSLITPHFY